MAKVAPKRKAANGYKLAEPLPKGEILQDIAKKKWKLGPSIGQGGFGEIYSAQEADKGGTKYPYVIKIEPHANGPLFVEMHFYMRNAKPDDVENFKTKKGLKTFGMPLYLGSGSHEYKGEKYRFIVMEKFGTDIWKIFLEHNRIFPTTTVFKLGVQILDVLEYIHEHNYVHADIKGANILTGATRDTNNKQVYLVDFGLATKFTVEKEFKPNPKKAHDGTIEYLSRDAHNGVQTRRGDLEILAYNLIQWLGCTLPWEKNLKVPNVVQKCKEEYMSSVPKMIKACFGNRTPPGAIVDFLNYLNSLKFDSEPDYKKIRKIFLSEIKNCGDTLESPLKFSKEKDTRKKSPAKRKSNQRTGVSPKRKVARNKKTEDVSDHEKENMEDDEDLPIDDQNDEDVDDIIEASLDEDFPLIGKKGKRINKKKEQNGDVASIPSKKKSRLKKNVNKTSSDDEPNETNIQDKNENSSKHHTHVDAFEGYTEAMKEVMKKKLQNGKTKGQRKRKQKEETKVGNVDGYTDSMKETVLKKTEKRSAKKGSKSNKTEVASASSTTREIENVRNMRSRQKQSYNEDYYSGSE